MNEPSEGYRRAFLSAFPTEGATGREGPSFDEATLDDELRSRHRRAQEIYPAITLSGESFARGLGVRVSRAAVKLDRLCSEDVYLAEACLAGDRAAIGYFEQQLLGSLRAAVNRASVTEADTDEVLQTLREELFLPRGGRPPKFALYSGMSPLQAWLRVVATRLALMRRRGRPKEVTLPSHGPYAIGSEQDAVTHALRGRYAGHFVVALKDACGDLEAEDRELLLLHVRDRLSIDALAPRFGLHRATVARRLKRVREAIFARTRTSMMAEYGLSDSTFDTLCRELVSNIALSLRHMLE